MIAGALVTLHSDGSCEWFDPAVVERFVVALCWVDHVRAVRERLIDRGGARRWWNRGDQRPRDPANFADHMSRGIVRGQRGAPPERGS